MIYSINNPIAIVCSFLWIGFVCAISFMEAWLKFQAPGISLSLGLEIGRLVFNALNRVEWILAIAIFVSSVYFRTFQLSVFTLLLFLSVVVLILQTVWLLPSLDQRAELLIAGQHVASHSNIHFWYVTLEVVKVLSLSIYGISLFHKLNYKK